jgi:hypothetical protein
VNSAPAALFICKPICDKVKPDVGNPLTGITYSVGPPPGGVIPVKFEIFRLKYVSIWLCAGEKKQNIENASMYAFKFKIFLM